MIGYYTPLVSANDFKMVDFYDQIHITLPRFFFFSFFYIVFSLPIATLLIILSIFNYSKCFLPAIYTFVYGINFMISPLLMIPIVLYVNRMTRIYYLVSRSIHAMLIQAINMTGFMFLILSHIKGECRQGGALGLWIIDLILFTCSPLSIIDIWFVFKESRNGRDDVERIRDNRMWRQLYLLL